MFRDRADAGRQLAVRLRGYASQEGVILAIPRGAVVLAAEIAREIGWPLDLVIVRKIGHPDDPEYAVGAVDPAGNVLKNPATGVSDDYLSEAATLERAEIERRLAAYRGGRAPLDVEGRAVILVDDGVATGLTALKAVRYLRDMGASHIVLAVPVIARQAAEALEPEVDELVALQKPALFWAVGGFYASFPQVSDTEVGEILGKVGAA